MTVSARSDSLPLARRILAGAADLALEGTVVLSFSRVGYDVRSRLFRWTDLTERPLHGRVAIVTGATSGLGLAAATRLATLGASVRLLGRDIGRTDTAREQIVALSGNSDVEIGVADLASLDDVRRYVAQIQGYHDRLDILVNNAGALVRDHELTADGMEITAQTHVVAPFLLTAELMPLLSQTPGSRVISVSSGGMYTERLDLDRLEMGPDGFDGVKAYARAKRAQVVLTGEWAERARSSGVTFHAMHPGWVDTPGVRRSLPGFSRVMGPLLRTPDQGADTMVWLASAAEALDANGAFWLDRHRRWTSKLPWTGTSAATAAGLWAWTAERAGVSAIAGPEVMATP